MTSPLLNNSTRSLEAGRIEFNSFDKVIETHLEERQQYSHRLINEVDKPSLIWSLREWLLRTIGCFEIVGYTRYPEISYWFDRSTVIEEFDELLLLFRDYINQEKGIDSTARYKLIRYQDNLNFILVPIDTNVPVVFADVQPDMISNISELWPEFEKEFATLEKRLNDKFGHKVDVTELFNTLLWDGNGLLWKMKEFAKIEE